MTTELVDIASKVCHVCAREKPLTEFYRCTARQGKDGYRTDCKACGAERNASWRKNNPETVRAYNAKHNTRAKDSGKARDWNLRRKYGISEAEFQELLARQGGHCVFCDQVHTQKSPLHVDHDHSCCPGNRSCGKCIRGLLCFHCNTLLGHSRENIVTLENAIQYLKAADHG